MLLNFYAGTNNIRFLFIITFIIADVLTILIGPLVYVYVKSLFVEDSKLIKKNRFHFIIPLIYLLLFSIPILIYILSASEVLFTEGIESPDNIEDNIKFLIEDLFLLVYAFFTLKLLSKYKKAAKLSFSNLKNKELIWVKHMLFGVFFIVLIDFFASIYNLINYDSTIRIDFIIILLIVLFLYYLGYYGINQSRVLVPEFLLNPINERKPSINLQNLDEASIKKHILKIKEVLSNDKLFLDEDLTLNKLANQVNLSEKKLSAIINQEMNTSFYDLINSYRIAEFKKRIVSTEFDNLTILGIAFDCGFKSKSTFNRLFKLSTGKSPSEYKKQTSPNLSKRS